MKLAATPHSDKPLAGMCDSTRCPQATHHKIHRPVWQEKADVTRVLIKGLPRRQRTERQRLQAELTRIEKVLADIDTANPAGTTER